MKAPTRDVRGGRRLARSLPCPRACRRSRPCRAAPEGPPRRHPPAPCTAGSAAAGGRPVPGPLRSTPPPTAYPAYGGYPVPAYGGGPYGGYGPPAAPMGYPYPYEPLRRRGWSATPSRRGPGSGWWWSPRWWPLPSGGLVGAVVGAGSQQTIVEQFFPNAARRSNRQDIQAVLAKVEPAVVSIDSQSGGAAASAATS